MALADSRRRPVGARRRDPQRAGRQGPRAGGLPDPGPGPEVEGHDADGVRRRGSTTSSTTGRSRPRSTASRSSSPGPAGPARSATRSTCATRRAAATCGTGSWRPAGRTSIRPIAPCEARRIEAGIFNYGSDITINDTPFHVMGLERLVEPQDADYIGKAALEEIRAKGVDRKLVGIEVDGDALPFELSRKCVRAPRRRAGRDRDRPDLVAAARARTSATCGCRSGWPARATRSRSRRPTAAAGRPDRRDPVPRPEEGRPAEDPIDPQTTLTARSPLTADEIAAVRKPYRAASLLPGRAYHDQAIHDFERREWFRRDWMVVGREEDAPSAGTYFLATIDDEPLLIARGRDGRPAGVLQRLPPPRHGRRRGAVRHGRPVPVPVPRLDLRPRGQPHPGQAHRRSRRLRHAGLRAGPVRLETWQGFVFVNLDPETPPLVEWLGDLAAASGPLRLRQRSVSRTPSTYEVDTNWKFVAENYSECYHCPGSIPSSTSSRRTTSAATSPRPARGRAAGWSSSTTPRRWRSTVATAAADRRSPG